MIEIKFDGSLPEQMNNWHLAGMHGVEAVKNLYEIVGATQTLTPKQRELVDKQLADKLSGRLADALRNVGL